MYSYKAKMLVLVNFRSPFSKKANPKIANNDI